MGGISVKTKKPVFPMIYAYSTPNDITHVGWTKIGYTESQTVEGRVHQHTHTSDTGTVLEWKGAAIFDDGSGDRFTDDDFHAYLKKTGVENKKNTEWYHVDGPQGRMKFYEFRADRGILKAMDNIPYTLRKEQQEAVNQTVEYRKTHEGGSFLWNAKPRFGKTLSVYDFCKTIKAQNVLIVTNRPAIANSWYSDYCQFMGDESGYKFVSETESLKGQKYVLTRQEYSTLVKNQDYFCIEFVSLQDLKGARKFGGKFEKLEEIEKINWDVLVVDEAHEGVDTMRTEIAFDQIKRKFTLHLSGTPFKAIANDKFRDNEIFNWTYADEQRAKRDWVDETKENPYGSLPYLNMYTYQMSEIISDEIDRGLEIDGEEEEYAFDLGLFFATDGRGKFIHDSSVDRFLDAMTTQNKFPFSTPELRSELAHTFWLLNRVDSAKALAYKLKRHPVFSEYEIVLAAGDGKLDDEEEIKKSFDRVKEAIRTREKTITLSVGQLTTGVTIPEWTAVLMLSNIKSPALYMQAAFRAQNPCMFHIGGEYFRKENAYLFDFDPARTLTIYEEFANDLASETAAGKGDMEKRRNNVKELLNFFPVIGEDENGEMVQLDAEKVLSIPRKIRSQEVVRRGFMSNYLFQNVGVVFNAPQSVLDIIKQFQPIKEPVGKDIPITPKTGEELSINPETGEVEIPAEQVIGTATDMFGDPIYASVQDGTLDALINDTVTGEKTEDGNRSELDAFSEKFKSGTIQDIVDKAKGAYGGNMTARDAQKLKKSLENKFDYEVEKVRKSHDIEVNNAEKDYFDELIGRFESGKTTEEIETAYEQKKKELQEGLQEELHEMVDRYIHTVTEEIVDTTETRIKDREKKSIEDSVKDHLRGFSRTIPSFLMAYGENEVTLANFDKIIPDDVFIEVTSISLEQFRLLRDGGMTRDPETGEMKQFAGNIFDPIVFDDSVREFMRLKKQLANYFDEDSTEDIFDYIPPQRTNQIFTPKRTVKLMMDKMEKENPGCFDDPERTFVDLYMKSGLFITEVVKRLFKSEEMKIWYEDPKERLKHIFAKQVYGLAPTEIIYRIALSYVLGFDDAREITGHNLRQEDALPYAQEGKLEELLDSVFE